MNIKKRLFIFTLTIFLIPISIWSITQSLPTQKASVKGIRSNKIINALISPTKIPMPASTQSAKLTKIIYKKTTPTPNTPTNPTNNPTTGSTQTSSNTNTNNQNNNPSTFESSTSQSTPTPTLDSTITSTPANQASVSMPTTLITPPPQPSQPTTTPATPLIQPTITSGNNVAIIVSNGNSALINDPKNEVIYSTPTPKPGNTATIVNQIITTPTSAPVGAYAEVKVCKVGQTCP